MRKFINWIRFGRVSEIVKAIDCSIVSEIEYRGRFGKIVGYWAYGSFDPALPFKG